MTWNAEKALREGIETQQQRVDHLREQMQMHEAFCRDYKRWHDEANGHLQRMLELAKQREELK